VGFGFQFRDCEKNAGATINKGAIIQQDRERGQGGLSMRPKGPAGVKQRSERCEKGGQQLKKINERKDELIKTITLRKNWQSVRGESAVREERREKWKGRRKTTGELFRKMKKGSAKGKKI